LTRRSIEPIFKENYHTYDKDEFLIDADFEFVKIKNLLSKSPKLLKEDPILSIDYLKIINLIKQKKLLENTTDQFDPTAAVEAHHFDIQKMERAYEMRDEQIRERFAKHFEEQGPEVAKGIDDYDANLESQIKNDKKAQAREQLKIIKQFDSLAD
jgi:tRNA A37 N6-isopentenylltransferase MiaA